MCGILAIFCRLMEKDISDVVKGYMMLANRGPDTGHLDLSGHVFGFRRLSIVDTTSRGMQPFRKEGATLVCNGEIYNHEELESKHNIVCESRSDCECIIHLYKKYGFEKTMNMLSGDFACVIIDGDYMYFGRDRIGVRPLFYGRTRTGNVAVASYARAIMDYCTEVHQVPPGWVKYDTKTNQFEFYTYSFPTYKVDGPGIHTLIRNTLTSAVKSRLMTERPIACMLSGGLDSSLIVSILCKLVGPTNVRTYSIGMRGAKDLVNAKIVADFLGTKHTEIVFTPQEGIDAIPNVIQDLESYDITTVRASVGMWILSKWIKANTEDTVLLSGEGSDELFCGYLYFHYAPDTKELEDESMHLVKNLYLYDVLRADRCVSSHGLELRVPFLDKKMIDLCLTIPGELKRPIDGMEKKLLRDSFKDGYLPETILWRRKDGFSDGCSSPEKHWYQYIEEYVDNMFTDSELVNSGLPSKEAMYYRKLYNDMFPTYQPVYDYWLPKWVNHGGNPSGRILQVFEKDTSK
jgi:asparagine synthase (glutamine-hydrolysing)